VEWRSERESNKPIIGVLLGDPSGIGPELVIKLSRASRQLQAGERRLLAIQMCSPRRKGRGALTLDFRRAACIGDLAFERRAYVCRIRLDRFKRDRIGRATVRVRSLGAGESSQLPSVRAGAIDGVVFAPFNKHAMRIAGLRHEDEMRFLQEALDVSDFVTEFNITGSCGRRASLRTSRSPRWPRRLTEQGVSRRHSHHRSETCGGRCRTSAHCGRGTQSSRRDGGSFGREEIDIIEPAVRSLALKDSMRAARTRRTPCFVAAGAAISMPWLRCITIRGRSR
jgi:4-hydroxythreonine-4-phosphate dehydrogenase